MALRHVLTLTLNCFCTIYKNEKTKTNKRQRKRTIKSNPKYSKISVLTSIFMQTITVGFCSRISSNFEPVFRVADGYSASCRISKDQGDQGDPEMEYNHGEKGRWRAGTSEEERKVERVNERERKAFCRVDSRDDSPGLWNPRATRILSSQ